MNWTLDRKFTIGNIITIAMLIVALILSVASFQIHMASDLTQEEMRHEYVPRTEYNKDINSLREDVRYLRDRFDEVYPPTPRTSP